MRRIITTSIASSLLAFALPAAASAHGPARHDGARRAQARHHRHHHHAHTVVFTHGATTTVPGTGTPVTPSPTPSEGEPAGTIASFEGGVLKITLADGSTVSGKVTEATRIECGVCPNEGSGGSYQGEGHDGFVRGDDERGSGQDQGDDDGPGSNEGEPSEAACGQAALKPGAKVAEAELGVTSAGSIWQNVVLAR